MQNELLWGVIRMALVFGPPLLLAPVVYRAVLRFLDRREALHASTGQMARATRVAAVAPSEAVAGI